MADDNAPVHRRTCLESSGCPKCPNCPQVSEKKNSTSRNGAGNALKSLPTSQKPKYHKTHLKKNIKTVQFGRHCAPGHLMTRTSPVGNSNTTMEGVELYLAKRLCQQEKETTETAQLLEKQGKLTLKTTTGT